ncbi:MAG: hypothetical protein IJU81_02535 [Bacteroidales bacterium]|nr:hypothetical protein [Bacteroidales bacterium]
MGAATNATALAAGAAATLHDDIMGPRKLAGVTPDKPVGDQAVAYRDKLSSVDATTRTADNILTVFGDPKKVLGLIMTVLLIVWLLSKFGDKITGFLSSLISPVAHLFDIHRAEALTGTVATLTNSQAAALADNVHSCFQSSGDDEEALYAYLRTLNTPADWQALCNAYGTRQCLKRVAGIPYHNQQHDLPTMIRCNLTDNETAKIRQILANIGVTF